GSRATVLGTGAVFRCRPDGSKIHTFAIGFRHPYGDVAFDANYQIFHRDNVGLIGDLASGRLLHVAEGNDFGLRISDYAARGDLPGRVTPLRETKDGTAAGLLIYNDTRFPEPYRGLLYAPDFSRIRARKVEPEGASFKVTEEFELMHSSDPPFTP